MPAQGMGAIMPHGRIQKRRWIANRHPVALLHVMLDLRRLRLLHELHARGTIAAVADALQFTPSAVSQQLAVLEREAGVPLLERGRARRPADRRRARARRPRRGAARPRRARGGRAGRRRRQRRRAGADRRLPVGGAAARRAGDARARRAGAAACAASSSRPSRSRRCRRSRSATSTSCWPTSGSTSRTRGPPGLDRHDLHRDPVRVVLPADHAVARRQRRGGAAGRAGRRARGRPATRGRAGRR